jgi:hypothetical protein
MRHKVLITIDLLQFSNKAKYEQSYIFNVFTTKFLDQVTFIQNSMFYINLFGNHVHLSISQPKQQVGEKTFEGECFTLFHNKLLKPTVKIMY